MSDFTFFNISDMDKDAKPVAGISLRWIIPVPQFTRRKVDLQHKYECDINEIRTSTKSLDRDLKNMRITSSQDLMLSTNIPPGVNYTKCGRQGDSNLCRIRPSPHRSQLQFAEHLCERIKKRNEKPAFMYGEPTRTDRNFRMSKYKINTYHK